MVHGGGNAGVVPRFPPHANGGGERGQHWGLGKNGGKIGDSRKDRATTSQNFVGSQTSKQVAHWRSNSRGGNREGLQCGDKHAAVGIPRPNRHMAEILRVLSMEAVERAAEGLAVWEHLRGKVADNFQTWKQECKFGRHRREESRYRVVRVLECVEAGSIGRATYQWVSGCRR